MVLGSSVTRVWIVREIFPCFATDAEIFQRNLFSKKFLINRLIAMYWGMKKLRQKLF